MKQKIAVIGAFTHIGRAILDRLACIDFNGADIQVFDFRANMNSQIPYGDDFLIVQGWENLDWVDVIFLCEATILSEYKDELLRHSAYVIDCVGIMAGAPCIVADLNIKSLSFCKEERIITNPTSLTILLSQILNPIHQKYHIKNAEVVALLASTSFGTEFSDALLKQSRSLYTREPISDGPYPKTQAFNLIPEISPVLVKQSACQMKSILSFPTTITSCLTPIFQGEAYAVCIQVDKKCSLPQMIECLSKNKKCRVLDDVSPYMNMTTLDTVYQNSIFISHFYRIPYLSQAFHFWALCDGIYTGSAFNAVQICQYLLS